MSLCIGYATFLCKLEDICKRDLNVLNGMLLYCDKVLFKTFQQMSARLYIIYNVNKSA